MADQIPGTQRVIQHAWAQDGASLTRLKHMMGQTIEKWLAEEDGSSILNPSQQHQSLERPRDQQLDENENPPTSIDGDRSVGMNTNDSRGEMGTSSKGDGLNNTRLPQQTIPAAVQESIQEAGDLSRRGSVRPGPPEVGGSLRANHQATRILPSSLGSGDEFDELVVLPPLRNNSNNNTRTEAFRIPNMAHLGVAAPRTVTKAPRKKLPGWAHGPFAR